MSHKTMNKKPFKLFFIIISYRTIPIQSGKILQHIDNQQLVIILYSKDSITI